MHIYKQENLLPQAVDTLKNLIQRSIFQLFFLFTFNNAYAVDKGISEYDYLKFLGESIEKIRELINIAIMVNRIWSTNYMNYPLFKLR